MKLSRPVLAAVLPILLLLAACPAAPAAVKFTRVNAIPGGVDPDTAMARTPDGTLHLAYETTAQRNGTDGVAARSISAGGSLGQEVQALSGWQAGLPGLVSLPGGQLEAVFGAISPNNVPSIWGISSSDGGANWTAPTDVRSGPNEAQAYGAQITAKMSGSTPVLTVPQAGNLIIQQGLGPNTPTFQLNTTPADSPAVDVDSAVDAATGEVVASWQSLASPLGLFLQGAAPTVGSPQPAPGQHHSALVIAGRDAGPGVFGSYSTDNKHVRLLRYGGGTVAVGSRKGVAANVLGVATGLNGRMWALWGDDSGLALTRSKKAVTKFEPIQHIKHVVASIYRLAGDGRLGPLDLFVDEIPDASPIQPAGSFWARVLPVLSASLSVNKAHKLAVKVTDAGDDVSGATVAAAGKKATTNGSGVATLTLPKSASGHVPVTISAAGYRTLKRAVKI